MRAAVRFCGLQMQMIPAGIAFILPAAHVQG